LLIPKSYLELTISRDVRNEPEEEV